MQTPQQEPKRVLSWKAPYVNKTNLKKQINENRKNAFPL